MKTSNKLVISVIFLGMAVTMTMFLLAQNHFDKERATSYIWKNNPLPSFSVVVAMGQTEFNVECSDSNQVKCRVPNNNSVKMQAAKYFVKNDTLFVQQTTTKQNLEDRLVVCCRSLKSVSTTRKDLVELRRLQIEQLDIRNTKSQIYVNNWEYASSNPLVLNVMASDSAYVDLYNVTISRLNASLDHHSAINSHEHVSIAEAQIKRTNSSNYAFERLPLKLLVESDTTTGW